MAYKDPADQRAAQQAHYQRNKTAYIERGKQHRLRIRKMIHEAKSVPCADCGVQYPFYVMTFDHRPGEIKWWPPR